MASKNISMTDYGTEQQSIDRRRKMAELLQQQALTPDQGQMVGGTYVAPHWSQGVSKLAQALMSKRGMEDADTRQTALGDRQRKDLAEGLQSYQSTLQGTPAQQSQIVDDEYGPQTINEPAVPGNRQQALAQLLSSNHPMLQQMGAQMMMKEPEKANNFGKIDPKDYTKESIAKFVQTQNFADLDRLSKREFVNDTAIDPYATPIGMVIPKRGNPFADLLVADANGNLIQNAPLIQAKKDIAKSGKTDVNVKTDIKMNEGLAGQVGPMMKDSALAAEGAAQQAEAAQRIIQAVDSGKVMAGPGASAQLKLAQIGNKIGVSGKDDAERIANTRQTIQGLAELTLQGRKQMRGQGAITEGESKLAERVISGDIDSLTDQEIKQVAKAADRSARWVHQQHNRKVEQMRKTPGLEGVTPFYEAPQMPAEYVPQQAAPTPAATAPSNGGWSIKPVR